MKTEANSQFDTEGQDDQPVVPLAHDVAHGLYQKGVEHRYGTNGAKLDIGEACALIKAAYEGGHYNALGTLIEIHRDLREAGTNAYRANFKEAVMNEDVLTKRALEIELFDYLQTQVRHEAAERARPALRK